MNKKNKAAKAINTALGLIVIIAVILCSPLFGYGRGFASREQREAAASASGFVENGSTVAAPTATPRPTPLPTATPVVLPTAPPTPEPTSELAPTAKPAAVQQNAQQTWQQEAAWNPEEYNEEGEEEDYGEAEEESDGSAMQADVSGDVTYTDDGQVIQNQNADLVIQGVGYTGEDPYEEPAAEPAAQEPSADAGADAGVPQDGSESDAYLIG